MSEAERKNWYEKMKLRYNTDEDGVREIMRQRQKKSRLSGGGGGRFKQDPDYASKMGREGAKKRWGKSGTN